jgi:DNA-binding beta-propeller fold protein YncE
LVLQHPVDAGEMNGHALLRAIAFTSLLAGCAVAAAGQTRGSATVVSAAASSRHTRTHGLAPPQALVTDELQNKLLVVGFPSAGIVRSVALPVDPEDVAATGDGGLVIVVSSRAGKVSVLQRAGLRTVKTFAGFDQPHIVAVAPDGRYAFVTDDMRGTLTAIRLRDLRVTSTVMVGVGAHHIAISPIHRRMWIALGEAATRISILDTTDLGHPRPIGQFSPGFRAHDLSFSPNGRQVWVSSAVGPDVTAFDASSRRVLFRLPVGPPPQHIAMAHTRAYLTSGYGGTIEMVDTATGRVLARARTPYGSFELAVADGYVATTSLLRGAIAIFTPGLKLVRVAELGPATRELAISRP